jgi:Nuclease-related domain
MQIKAADDKKPDIAVLEGLLSRPDVSRETRDRIQHEIESIRGGEKTERSAAYEIEFHYAANPNVMTLHDLRIEFGGRVAQIDHLIIDRLLEIWVCESKSFSGGVKVDEYGEWLGYWGGRAHGIPSPIEQNRKHVAVLQDVFTKGVVAVPKRLGFPLVMNMRPVVLVSNTGRVTRPKGRAASRVDGLDTVIKSEQLYATISRSFDPKDVGSALATIATSFVSAATAERLARDLAALHKPTAFDWVARFGLASQPNGGTKATSAEPDGRRTSQAASGPVNARQTKVNSAVVCESCGRPVSEAVVAFCRSNSRRFAGRILCMTCQRVQPRPS